MPSTVSRKWIRSEADEHAVRNGCSFDIRAAERVGAFFRQFICHSKGRWAGQPFELLDWQRDDLIYPLFGWKRPDGTRRYRKAYVEIPKKNGKSTLAAGIGLYMLAGDAEPGAEVYSAATDRTQANIVHREAINMVKASPALSAALAVHGSTFNISNPKTNSFYRALSAEASSKEGLNASAIIADELHVWYGRALWDALLYAGRSRKHPLLFVITTAGDDMQSICREQHDYAEKIIKGQVFDDRFFGYIRAADPEDSIDEPATWRKANPSMGITIDEQEFKADIDEAKKTPTTLASMKRYSFNIWATTSKPWLRMTDWEKCGETFDAESLEGQPCYAALDLAKVSDMTALVLLFPIDDGPAKLLPFFWLPTETAEQNQTYAAWAQAEHLILTPGSSTDFLFVKKRIVELKDRFDIRGLAFDDHYASELVTSLADEHGMTVHAFPQTITAFAGPTAKFERMVVDGQLRHNRNPVLTWHAGNTNVKTDVNGNMRPVKPPEGQKRKIDGIVAAIMALGESMRFPTAAARSVYEDHGLQLI